MEEDTQERYPLSVELTPFKHKVGGHTAILDSLIVLFAKPWSRMKMSGTKLLN